MTKTIPIADKTLWDSCGNSCRVELHMLGHDAFADSFELYLHEFNSAIPARHVGKLGVLNSVADNWIASKKAAGFVEQLLSYNPEAWRA